MNGTILIAALVFFPMLAAIPAYALGRGRPRLRSALVVGCALLELALTLLCVFTRMSTSCTIAVCGIYFELDGFRAIYACIVAFMWAMTALFSPDYFAHYHNRGRYYYFFLMTLGATQGVFLSADLKTTLLFFEVMSFTSYTWVAHEQNSKAMRAANTYLAIAVIGGLAALMGLFLLDTALGTLRIRELYEAALALQNKTVLYVAGGCMLFGFGAKAGMFPLHIWLPKAHPVAPAPASALLSGVLTKTGIYGVLIISCDILRHDAAWGTVLLVLGVITMVLGAVLALFSIDLKRTLACSSMSQIGFILVGIAMQCLLAEDNALAANGTILHMVNHSLIKLDLFMVAGVVYKNTHKLNLNDIRGWGRGKPLLNLAFLLGLLGIGGIPGFNGYISKTLLHESIVEFAHHTGNPWITVVEWLFLFSGGITLTYMTKLYVCIFLQGQKPTTKEPYMTRLSAIAITLSALVLPMLGMLPYHTQDRIAALATPFMSAGELHHHVHYFIWMNLKGAVISVVISALLYLFVVRKLLTKQENGVVVYLDRWPVRLDLENLFYRPLLLKWLPALGGSIICLFGENKILRPFCRYGMKAVQAIISFFGENRLLTPLCRFGMKAVQVITSCFGENRLLAPICRLGVKAVKFVSAFVCNIPDGMIFLLRKTVYRDSPFTPHEHKYFGLAHSIGASIDRLRTRLRLPPRKGESYAELATDAASTISHTTTSISNDFSFAMLMACLGICALILYLLIAP